MTARTNTCITAAPTMHTCWAWDATCGIVDCPVCIRCNRAAAADIRLVACISHGVCPDGHVTCKQWLQVMAAKPKGGLKY